MFGESINEKQQSINKNDKANKYRQNIGNYWMVLEFEPYIKNEEIQKEVKRVASEITRDCGNEKPLCVFFPISSHPLLFLPVLHPL